jgi:hypothetical protein
MPRVPDTSDVRSPASVPGRHRLTALRLVAQRIGPRDLAAPGDVVRWMLAMQAQDLPGAKWSVGLRAAGATEAAVEAACDSGEIVRSWPMRGTLHFVAGEDLGWLLAVTSARATASVVARRAALELTDSDVERARATAITSLSGGRWLSREGLLAAIAADGVSTVGQRGYHILWYLAQTATLVLGPTDGRQQAFVLLDEWVTAPRRLDRDEALGEIVTRYVRSHGPATVADIARWCGLTVADVRRGLAQSDDLLTVIEIDGVGYHVAPEVLEAVEAPKATSAAAGVHFLPGFDEYLLGYRDRSAALAPEHADAIVPGANGMFKPTIVVDGQVVGTWKRTVRARDVTVEPTTFAPLSAAQRDGLARAAHAYGAYLGRRATLAGQDAPAPTLSAVAEPGRAGDT